MILDSSIAYLDCIAGTPAIDGGRDHFAAYDGQISTTDSCCRFDSLVCLPLFSIN